MSLAYEISEAIINTINFLFGWTRSLSMRSSRFCEFLNLAGLLTFAGLVIVMLIASVCVLFKGMWFEFIIMLLLAFDMCVGVQFFSTRLGLSK